MTQRAVVFVVLATVLLAGCLGGPTGTETGTTPTETASGPGSGPAGASNAAVPGVSNGSLTNATALAAANEAALSAAGGEIETGRTEGQEEISYRLRVGTGLSTYSLSGGYPAGDGQRVEMDIWSNETTRYVRTGANGDVRYRVIERDQDTLNSFSMIESHLAGGQFTVRNESTGDGRIVLIADSFESPSVGASPFSDVSEYSGRLVVDGEGRIHNLTVSAVDNGRPVAYRYVLLGTGVDRVAQPDWLAEVPESATLQPDLDITVEEDAYFVVRHRGGDAVPADSTLSVESDGEIVNATFETSLGAGDTRYAYRAAGAGGLHLAAEPPGADDVTPLESPVSVTLETGDGATLYSGGMAWGSGSESAGDGESAGGGSSGSDGT